MGNYASTTELKARFEDDDEVARLTDSADTGTPDDTVLNEVIDDAESEINSYVAVKHLVPLTVSGNSMLAARMKSVTLNIAVANLLDRSGVIAEPKAASRERSIAWCKDIKSGEAVLPSATTEASTKSREPLVNWGTGGTGTLSKRLFTRATMDGL